MVAARTENRLIETCREPSSPATVLLGAVAPRGLSWENDAVARTRTWDHLVNSEVLYHLSYDGPTHPYVVGLF